MRRASRALIRAFWEAKAGAQAVEFALVLPVLLAFVFGVIEVGRALWTQATLQAAVEDAARCAAINTTICGAASATQTYAASRVGGLTIPASSFAVLKPSCGEQVSISYAFNSVIAPLVPISVTLNASACHP